MVRHILKSIVHRRIARKPLIVNKLFSKICNTVPDHLFNMWMRRLKAIEKYSPQERRIRYRLLELDLWYASLCEWDPLDLDPKCPHCQHELPII